MIETASLEVTNDIAAADLTALHQALTADTAMRGLPVFQAEPLGIFRRGKAGALLGGLTGRFLWDWLYIDLLWVHESQRQRGLGRMLVLEAEQAAQARRCQGVWLWTQSFQVPGFYQKLGYEAFARFPDFPQGHQRIGFMKNFSAPEHARKAG